MGPVWQWGDTSSDSDSPRQQEEQEQEQEQEQECLTCCLSQVPRVLGGELEVGVEVTGLGEILVKGEK